MMNIFQTAASGSGAGVGRADSGVELGGPDKLLWQHLLFACAALGICAIAGLAVVHVDPLFVGGALFTVFFIYLVLKSPFFGLVLYVAIFMGRPGEVYESLAPLRSEMLIGALTVVSFLLRQLHSGVGMALDGSRQTKLLYLVIVAAFISMPFAYYRLGAWTGFVDFLKILIFYLLVLQLVNTRKRLWIFSTVYFALVVHIAFESLKNFYLGEFLYAQGIERVVGATSAGGGANKLGATMATTFPILFLFSFHKKLSLWWRVPIFLSACLVGYTMLLTGSRSGLVGFIGGAMYMWWKSRHRMIFAILGLTFAIGAFPLLPEQYQNRYMTMTQSEIDDSSNERLKAWTKGMHMVADRPLTGVGINCFETANAMTYSTGRASWLESHSLYVQVPAEMGLIGALTFFWFLAEGIRNNRRASRKIDAENPSWDSEKLLLHAILTGTVVLLFTGVFGHSMMRRTWYVYAALGLCTLRMQTDYARSAAGQVVGAQSG